MGRFTRGEATGLYNLVKGACLLFRNAAAHRPITCTASEAEDIVHLVNLCLRLLPSTVNYACAAVAPTAG